MNDVPRNMQKAECKIFYKNGELANKWRFSKKEGSNIWFFLMSCLQSWYSYTSKVVSATFLSPKEGFCRTRKNVFNFSNQMLRKSKFGIVDIQTSRLYQMPKHKTNTFYWITWEVYTVCWWYLAILQKETFY